MRLTGFVVCVREVLVYSIFSPTAFSRLHHFMHMLTTSVICSGQSTVDFFSSESCTLQESEALAAEPFPVGSDACASNRVLNAPKVKKSAAMHAPPIGCSRN